MVSSGHVVHPEPTLTPVRLGDGVSLQFRALLDSHPVLLELGKASLNQFLGASSRVCTIPSAMEPGDL